MIVAKNVIDMILHWLATEPNSYFGSGYGAPINSLFCVELNTPIADSFVQKMKTDLPILEQLNSDQLSLFVRNDGFEKKMIILKVGEIKIDLSEIKIARDLNVRGETFNANAN